MSVGTNNMVLFWSIIIVGPFLNLTDAMSSAVSDANPEASNISLQPAYNRDRAYEVAMTMDFEIELSISVENLTGTFIKNYNPQCIIYVCQYNNDVECVEYQRTEILENEANPKFARKVMMSYSPYQEQRVFLFNVGSESSFRKKVSDLGQKDLSVRSLLSNGISKLPLTKRHGAYSSKDTGADIVIHAEKLSNNYDEIIFTLAGVNLVDTGRGGLPDPYVEIYKHSATDRDEYVLVYRTQKAKSTANPVWGPIDIPVRSLCNGEFDRGLKFVILHWNRGGSVRHKLIGEFTTTLNDLVNDDDRKEKIFPLAQPGNDAYHYGSIKIYDVKESKIPSFADFVRDGLKLHGTIAIDYTALNGSPKKPGTLHYKAADGILNQYEKALTSVVNAIEIFGDKKFSVLGFGAKYKESSFEDLVFNMSPDGSSELSGIEEILQAYRHCAHTVMFYWPTQLERVIERFMKIVNDSKNPNDYFVLFILTRGGIQQDVEQIENMIRKAAALPLSIVFIGIGGSTRKFESLIKLDADRVRREYHRHIVQFVQFNTFNPTYDSLTTKQYFESELLLEIPTQVVSYMRSHGLKLRSDSSVSASQNIP